MIAAFLYLGPTPPVVSANEILRNSELAIQKDLHSVPAAVIHQRIRVRRKPSSSKEQTSTDLEFWRSTSGVKYADTASRTGFSAMRLSQEDSGLRSDFQKVCEENALDWREPLSAESYLRWHDGLKSVLDSVREDQNTILTTTVPHATGDGIRRAEFVVRRADWHPLELKLALGDREFDISEISYEVIKEARLQPITPVVRQIAPLPAVQPVSEIPAPIPALTEPAPPAPVPASDGDTEMTALWEEIQKIGKEPSQPMAMFCCNGGEAVLHAPGVSASRRSQLEQLVAQFPNLKLDFSGAAPNPVSQPAALNAEPRPAFQEAAGAKLQESIAKYFGSPEAQEYFAHKVMEETDSLLRLADGLRDLSQRFPPAEEAVLSSDKQAQLHRMFLDQVAVVRGPAALTISLLAPVLKSLEQVDSGNSPDQPPHWQAKAMSIFADAQRIDTLARRILTTTGDRDTSTESVQALTNSMAMLQQTLAAIPEK